MTNSYFVEVITAPFGGVFSCMTIEDGKETLTANIIKIYYKRMSILHSPSVAFLR
jgi:hypothetical protein